MTSPAKWSTLGTRYDHVCGVPRCSAEEEARQGQWAKHPTLRPPESPNVCFAVTGVSLPVARDVVFG